MTAFISKFKIECHCGLIGIPGHLHTVYVVYLFLSLLKLSGEKFADFHLQRVGGGMTSWFVHQPPDRVFRVRALAGNIGCTLGQDTQCLSPPGGVGILLVASCYRNRNKLRPDGPPLARMQTLKVRLKLSNLLAYNWVFVFFQQDNSRKSIGWR